MFRTFEQVKNEIELLCGDQFEIITPYIGSRDMIQFRCKKCGRIITYKQAHTVIKYGKIVCKCTKQTRKISQEEFERRVHEVCPDLKVLSSYKGSSKKVKFLYIPDNVIFEATPQSIYTKVGYPFNIYDSTQIIVGVNDMWTTHPEIAKLLKDPNDGYKYKYGTSQVLCFICPICGSELFYRPVNLFNLHGQIRCKLCLDTISYPEKTMICLLLQLGIDFVHQYSKKYCDWCNRFIYDFYIPSLNTIIETHGEQHYTNSIRGRKIENHDTTKRDLAIQNGISHYIEINCSKSEFDYIRNNILNSNLQDIINLSVIDWDKCFNDSLKPIIFSIISDWNNGLSIKELANKYKLNKETIRRKLVELQNHNALDRPYIGKRKKRPVICVETGQIFESVFEAQRNINPNVTGYNSHISKVINKENKTAYGYHWVDVA